MSDLINYNDLLQQLRDSVPSNLQDKAEKVNQAFNTALGVHMLLSHYDFYKSTFGDFADKMAEKGLQIKDTINNTIEDPTTLLDTQAGKTAVQVGKKYLNKITRKSQQLIKQPEENIELSTLRTPKATPVSEDVLFPGATGTDILPLANIVQESPAPIPSILPSGQAIEPSQMTSSDIFKSFTQMKPEPIRTSSFMELPSMEEGLSEVRSFISKGNAIKSKASSAYKALKSGDFREAQDSLNEAMSDPEFGQFVDPLRRATGNLFSKLGDNVQGALQERFNNVPKTMTDFLKNSGMSDENIKLSLMEPDEFTNYLRGLRGTATSKIDEMRQAYTGARGNVEEITNSLKNTAGNVQQRLEDMGDNMQERLQNLQTNLQTQAQEIENSSKQALIDASKFPQNVQPKTQSTNNPSGNIEGDIEKDAKSGLAELTEDSTALDEDPIGAGITTILGLATLGDTIYNALEINKPTPSQVGFQMGI
jgi:TolA-binding protein